MFNKFGAIFYEHTPNFNYEIIMKTRWFSRFSDPFWDYFWENDQNFFSAKFQNDSKVFKNFRFFGILQVFLKNIGNSHSISKNYVQNSLLVPSFIVIANFHKNTGFSGFYRYLQTRKFWEHFWEVRSKTYIFANVYAVLPYFTGILKKYRNSDMIFEF